MPDIIFTVSNTGVAIPTNAQGNSNVAGCYSRNGLDLLATSDELLNGLIVENSTSNWINRAKLLTMNMKVHLLEIKNKLFMIQMILLELQLKNKILKMII